MAAIGHNAPRTRSYNRRVVLETVRLHGPIGRAAIARRTDITAQAVSNIVADLLAEGLLREARARAAGRGQPPRELVVDPAGGLTLGIEIAPDAVRGVLLDLAGSTLARRERALRRPTPARVVPVLAAMTAALMAEVPGPRGRVLGAGVVMPGPFGVRGLTSVGPTALPGWAGTDAVALLETALGLPVRIENDATAAAVAERLHGVARDLRTFAFVQIGRGLGLGLVLDGAPFKGAFGNAGELGHVVVMPDGRPCACGNRGCLERYVSLQALEEDLAGVGLALADAGALAGLLAAGDAHVTAWLERAARILRPVVAMLENLFDPESIVIGGALPDPVLDGLIARLDPLLPSVAQRTPRMAARLLRGATGRFTPALGAAALPLFHATTPDLATAARPTTRSLRHA